MMAIRNPFASHALNLDNKKAAIVPKPASFAFQCLGRRPLLLLHSVYTNERSCVSQNLFFYLARETPKMGARVVPRGPTGVLLSCLPRVLAWRAPRTLGV